MPLFVAGPIEANTDESNGSMVVCLAGTSRCVSLPHSGGCRPPSFFFSKREFDYYKLKSHRVSVSLGFFFLLREFDWQQFLVVSGLTGTPPPKDLSLPQHRGGPNPDGVRDTWCWPMATRSRWWCRVRALTLSSGERVVSRRFLPSRLSRLSTSGYLC